MLRVTPAMFEAAVDQVAAMLTEWGWIVQAWGQQTIDPAIREILVLSDNGLRHIGDLLAARPEPTQRCPQCGRVHASLVCHLDVKSTTRSYDRQTGKLTLEIRSWSALCAETRTQIPAIFTFEPFKDCGADRLLWMPAVRLEARDMIFGPQTGNGSRDPYWLVPEGLTRRIATLRCWDGWS
jgi:hypothetical protein